MGEVLIELRHTLIVHEFGITLPLTYHASQPHFVNDIDSLVVDALTSDEPNTRYIVSTVTYNHGFLETVYNHQFLIDVLDRTQIRTVRPELVYIGSDDDMSTFRQQALEGIERITSHDAHASLGQGFEPHQILPATPGQGVILTDAVIHVHRCDHR